MAREPLPEGKLTPPVVPPRNDPHPLEPYARSRSLELQGRDPGYHYEWFRRDQLTDSKKTKLRSHEIGDQHTGYLMVDAWEIVDDKQGLLQGRQRDDAGKPVDTTVTNGELILCRTPLENYAKYAVIERKRDELIDKRLSRGEKHNFGDVTFKTRAAGGRDGLTSTTNDILQGIH